MESDYGKWKDEYLPNDIEDDDMMYRVKEAVDGLNSVQKKIFLTYTELGSYAAVGREFGVSTPTAKKYIERIKAIIKENI